MKLDLMNEFLLSLGFESSKRWTKKTTRKKKKKQCVCCRWLPAVGFCGDCVSFMSSSSSASGGVSCRLVSSCTPRESGRNYADAKLSKGFENRFCAKFSTPSIGPEMSCMR